MLVIAVIKMKDKTVGFRILDGESGRTKDVPYDNMVKVIENNKDLFENVECVNGEIIGTNGSLDRYPQIVDGQLSGKSPLIIIKKMEDAGYIVSDLNGSIKRVRTATVVEYGEKNGIANGKIVHNNDGTVTVSSIKGEYDSVSLDTVKKNLDETKKEIKKAIEEAETQSPDKATSIKGYAKSMNTELFNDDDGNTREVFKSTFKFPQIDIVRRNIKVKDRICDGPGGSKITLEQKLTIAVKQLREIKPFYHCIFSQLRRIFVDNKQLCATMGVSEHTLYINADFLAEISQGAVLFVLMHEICHIGMLHHSRKGESRNAEIWNYAGDLYINKLLSEELGINYGETGMYNGVQIELMYNAMFSSKVDTKKDTIEKIYEELMQSINQDRNGQGQGQGGQGQDQGQGQGQGGQGQDQDEQDGQGQGQGQGEGQGEGQGQQGEGQQGQGGQGQQSGRITFRGDDFGEYTVDNQGRVNGNSDGDLVEDKGEESTPESGKNVIERARVMAKTTGYSLSGSDGVERFIEQALAPVIPWQRLIKTTLLECSKTMNSFSKPNKRLIGQGIVLPGPKLSDPDKLNGVKICIDTSGSITDAEIGKVLKQIKEFMKRYKAKGEIIYWDTKVQSRGEFKDVKEALEIKPKGCGGTDPCCVFEYFEDKECKHKPSVIIFFTDGYLSWDSLLKYKKYDRSASIIWIINDDNYYNVVSAFEQDKSKFLGKVAKLNLDDTYK